MACAEDRAWLDDEMHGEPKENCDSRELDCAVERCLFEILNAAMEEGAPFVLPNWFVEIVVNRDSERPSPALKAWAESEARRRGMWRAPSPPDGVEQVYVVYRAADNAVKIGYSATPRTRLSALRAASSVPLRLLAVMPGPREVERAAHLRFASCCIGGEWFRVTDEIKQFVRDLGGAIA